MLPWGGHLAHEERPAEIVDLIRRVATETGVEDLQRRNG
jgi:magnesium chelatase accessory protein